MSDDAPPPDAEDSLPSIAEGPDFDRRTPLAPAYPADFASWPLKERNDARQWRARRGAV
jgi:hypothetical protein